LFEARRSFGLQRIPGGAPQVGQLLASGSLDSGLFALFGRRFSQRQFFKWSIFLNTEAVGSSADFLADENGKAVRTDCYFELIRDQRGKIKDPRVAMAARLRLR
jgi:hypothetical protein